MQTKYILTVFITIITVVDPLGLVPVYIPIANRFPREKRKYLIVNSCITAFFVAVGFLFGGKYLFEFLEINFNSLYIVGGILLFLIGLDMIYTRPKRVNRTPEENQESVSSLKEVSVFPLAIPMLSGPGMIATIIMFSSRDATVENYAIILAATISAFLLSAITMFFSDGLIKVLGKTGINVLDRVVGIILCSLAVQFLVNAILNIVASAKG